MHGIHSEKHGEKSNCVGRPQHARNLDLNLEN